MSDTAPTATPNPNPMATFPASWCANCGEYVGKIAGEWVHLVGTRLAACAPAAVAWKRESDEADARRQTGR